MKWIVAHNCRETIKHTQLILFQQQRGRIHCLVICGRGTTPLIQQKYVMSGFRRGAVSYSLVTLVHATTTTTWTKTLSYSLNHSTHLYSVHQSQRTCDHLVTCKPELPSSVNKRNNSDEWEIICYCFLRWLVRHWLQGWIKLDATTVNYYALHLNLGLHWCLSLI